MFWCVICGGSFKFNLWNLFVYNSNNDSFCFIVFCRSLCCFWVYFIVYDGEYYYFLKYFDVYFVGNVKEIKFIMED